MKKSLTTTEIARKAGVSQATVSRVLNGNSNVSIQKRTRVVKVIEKLQNKAKKFESTGEKRYIGIIMLYNSLDPQKYESITEALPEKFELLMLPRDISIDRMKGMFDSGKLSGVIFNGPSCDNHDLLEYLAERPHVWLNSHIESPNNMIFEGNEDAGRLAAQYLIKNDCKKLGAIGLKSYNPCSEIRIKSFLYEAFSSGIKADAFECNGHNSAFELLEDKEIEDDIANMIDRSDILHCDGIFCPDDRMTALFYRVLQKRNTQVYGNYKIISCNNDAEYLTGLFPRPATIDLAPGLTAKLALEHLIDQINGKQANDKIAIMVKAELIPGE